MKFSGLAVLAVAAVSFAIPATASAHPTVYTDTAIIDTDPDAGEYTEGTQGRHMVTNHGFTFVLRETNGATERGLMDYSQGPGDKRAGMSVNDWLVDGDTAAQPHATCRNVPALEADSAILGWQDTDPFYRYVPFQKASARLDDDPADWIDDVQALTAVDLTQVSDDPATAATQLETLCEDIDGPGGTAEFFPPDETQTPATNLAGGTVLAATEPLLAEIGQLETFTDQLEAQKAAAEQAAAAAQAQATSRAAEIARLTTPLSITPMGRRTPAQLAARGMSAEVTGPAGEPVTLRLLVSNAVAKALELRSRVLGKETATIGADGTALIEITLGRRAKAALRGAERSIRITFEALSGDRASATRRLAR